MKIQQLLEGTIKVPRNLYLEVMQLVCSDVFSRILSYLNSLGDESEYVDNVFFFEDQIRQYQKKYGRFEVFEDYDGTKMLSNTFYIRANDIDPRYFNKNPSAKNQTYQLIVSVTQSHTDPVPTGGYTKKQPFKPVAIDIEVPDNTSVISVAKAPETFDAFMDRIKGAVEHELMHSVQDLALKQIPKSLDYYDKNNNIINDKYYSSDVEFSPQIVSTAKDFIAYAKDLKITGGYNFDSNEKKQLLLSFVDPSARPPNGVTKSLSEFFKVLYNTDKQKWKKAIKYFYGLVWNKF